MTRCGATRRFFWLAQGEFDAFGSDRADFGQYSPPDSAPLRFSPARMIEYSAFADWQDVSARIYPLFANRAVLPEESKLANEAPR